MDCQQDIVEKVVERKADYFMAVKQNLKQLYQDIEDEFRSSKAIGSLPIRNKMDNVAVETTPEGDIHYFLMWKFKTRCHK